MPKGVHFSFPSVLADRLRVFLHRFVLLKLTISVDLYKVRIKAFWFWHKALSFGVPVEWWSSWLWCSHFIAFLRISWISFFSFLLIPKRRQFYPWIFRFIFPKFWSLHPFSPVSPRIPFFLPLIFFSLLFYSHTSDMVTTFLHIFFPWIHSIIWILIVPLTFCSSSSLFPSHPSFPSFSLSPLQIASLAFWIAMFGWIHFPFQEHELSYWAEEDCYWIVPRIIQVVCWECTINFAFIFCQVHQQFFSMNLFRTYIGNFPISISFLQVLWYLL